MDDNKDIQKSDSLSRFVDNQSVRTNPFGDNRIGERAYRRTERLVAALHLLTNHVPADEPLRRSVREISVKLLSEMLELRDEMRASNSAKLSSVEASIRNLISLLRMLAVSGFISIQNAEVAMDALDELGNFLNTSLRSALSESVRLSREDLLDVRDTARTSFKDIKDRPIVKDVRIQKDMTDTGKFVRNESNRARADEIMSVLKRSGELGIREIAAHLPEYSEKMIQRELARLISAGKVKKTGFKRWSKYSLTQ